MGGLEKDTARLETTGRTELDLEHPEFPIITDTGSMPTASEATGDVTQEQAVTDARQAVAAAFETTTASHDDGLGTTYRLFAEGL